MSTLPRDPKDGSLTDFLYRANLKDFQQKAIAYSLATIAALGLYLAFRKDVPLKAAWFLIAALGLEAGKNIKRWWEWEQENPRAGRMHPDRVAEIQQETVKVLSDAAKARAWFTRGIIACIAIPSVLEVFTGLDHAVAVASVDRVAVEGGAWWRLLSGTYLHGSLYHFIGNMSALFLYGSILESKTSPLRLPLVYLLSCLGGSFASVALPPDVQSVGASGGVVGIIGYLFLFSRRQEVKFPAAFRGATASVFVGLITAGLAGFWFIDNAGHAGGALTGIVLAALIVDAARNFGEEEVHLPILDFFGWIASAILIAGAVVTSLALLGP